METKLYVGNLSYSTTEDELRSLFTQAGEVKSVAVITDRQTGRSKGFAFVEMSSQEALENAIRMFNGTEVGGRPLTVNVARPREDRPRRPFNQGGGRNIGRGPNRGGGRGDR
jgi:RNA recognition motif-containing protein